MNHQQWIRDYSMYPQSWRSYILEYPWLVLQQNIRTLYQVSQFGRSRNHWLSSMVLGYRAWYSRHSGCIQTLFLPFHLRAWSISPHLWNQVLLLGCLGLLRLHSRYRLWLAHLHLWQWYIPYHPSDNQSELEFLLMYRLCLDISMD